MDVPRNEVICGDVIEELRKLPEGSIDCCITSPPYWSLRNYLIDPCIWGGKDDCEHNWNEIIRRPAGGTGKNASVGANKNDQANMREGNIMSCFCSKCGAWMGQLGLEPDPVLYTEHLMLVMDELWRVLKKSGSLWINLGDTYGGSGCGTNDYRTEASKSIQGKGKSAELYKTGGIAQKYKGVPRKSLSAIPERFVLAMLQQGWIRRNTLIWHKNNCLPEAVKDRFTRDFEYLYFFVKDARYYFEQQRRPLANSTIERSKRPFYPDHQKAVKWRETQKGRVNMGRDAQTFNREVFSRIASGEVKTANMRCVWDISTTPFSGFHFAVFPEKLVEVPIKAGCPRFICEKCGKPQVKVYEPTNELIRMGGAAEKTADCLGASPTSVLRTKCVKDVKAKIECCDCGVGFRPGIVLDPFGGSGTTGVVARRLGRDYVLIDKNPEYCEMARKRIRAVETGVSVSEQERGQVGLFPDV